jgi:hypothetical protein
MAQASQVVDLINRRLRHDHAIVDELIDVVYEWGELPDWQQASWTVDWDEFAVGDVPKLADYARSGRMSSEQMVSYQDLLNRLREQRPTMARLRLAAPGIPLDS